MDRGRFKARRSGGRVQLFSIAHCREQLGGLTSGQAGGEPVLGKYRRLVSFTKTPPPRFYDCPGRRPCSFMRSGCSLQPTQSVKDCPHAEPTPSVLRARRDPQISAPFFSKYLFVSLALRPDGIWRRSTLAIPRVARNPASSRILTQVSSSSPNFVALAVTIISIRSPGAIPNLCSSWLRRLLMALIAASSR